MFPAKTLRVLFSVLVACGIAGRAFAKECTCDDLDIMRQRAETAAKAEEAWKQIFAWARGLRQSPPLPSSNEQMDIRFIELLNAPSKDWDDIMSKAPENSQAPQKIGGMNDKGEPIINQDFKDKFCDDIIAGVKLHEETHKNFYLNYSWDHFLSILITSRLNRLRAESEVVSYRAEKEFLLKRIQEIEKDCGRLATATTPNGITYTAKRCEPTPYGAWQLTVAGAMSGQGSVTVNQDGSGSWSADANGGGVVISQVGTVQYTEKPNPQMRLTTTRASAMGHSVNPGNSLDLLVKFSGKSCPAP